MKTSYMRTLYIRVACVFFISVGIHAQEGTVKIQHDKRIDKLLDIKKELNKTDDGEKRYRIQIYSGPLDGARKSITNFKLDYPDWICDIRFETPNYKVWIGKYRARLEADWHLVMLKDKYPNAFILVP